MIAAEELESLVSCLSGISGVLSDLESRVLSLYLDGHSYEATAEKLECDTKTVDNALQRVKRKVALTSTPARFRVKEPVPAGVRGFDLDRDVERIEERCRVERLGGRQRALAVIAWRSAEHCRLGEAGGG